MGLNAALATSARALEVFATGVQVAGQNIANANTPGYVKEKLILQANFPYRAGQLVYGTGVLAGGIRQQIDHFLESRLRTATSDASGANATNSIYKELEATLNEFTSNDLSTSLDGFLSELNNVANQPEILANKQIAIRQGQQLADTITNLRTKIDRYREGQSTQIQSLVDEANKLIDTVQRLNPQIITTESAGLLSSDAGGLRNQRDAALKRLAEIIPIKVIDRPNTGSDIFYGNEFLLLNSESQHLKTTADTDRGVATVNIQLTTTETQVTGTSGELGGLLTGRDQVLGNFLDDLDQYTGLVIHEFNKLFASGQGKHGFSTVTATNSVSDSTASLNQAGLAFTPQHGSFEIQIVNKANGQIETTNIPVDLDGIGGDTSLTDLQTLLNGVNHVTASISADGYLTLAAGSGYEIRFNNDTSGTLAALGINTFFTGSNSTNIDVNHRLLDDADLFATGHSSGPSDSSNAVALAQFYDQPLSSLGNESLSDYYDGLVSKLGQDSATQTSLTEGYATYRDAIDNQKTQYSGVSVDEETIAMLDFQHSYQAAARVISTVNDLLEVLLTI